MNETLNQFQAVCEKLHDAREEAEKANIKYYGAIDRLGEQAGKQSPEALKYYQLKNSVRMNELELEQRMTEILENKNDERVQLILNALDIMEKNKIYTVNLLGHVTSLKMMRLTLTGMMK